MREDIYMNTPHRIYNPTTDSFMLANVSDDGYWQVMSASGPLCHDFQDRGAIEVGQRILDLYINGANVAIVEVVKINRKSITLRNISTDETINHRIVL